MMSVLRSKIFRLTFLCLFLAEILSFFGWAVPELGAVILVVILGLVFYLSCKDLRFGVGIALAELIIGSHGYLFSLPLGGFSVSLRFGIFTILLGVALFEVLRRHKLSVYSSSYFRPLLILAGFITLAFVNGLLTGNGFGNTFFDANAFLYFLLVIPIWEAIHTREDLSLLLQFGAAAILIQLILVFFLEYVFSHRFWWMLEETYRWIRDTRIGEITEIQPEVFYRVFLQSQIYTITAFFIFLLTLVALSKEEKLKNLVRRKSFWAWGLLTSTAFASILISFSRSNWVGVIASAVIMPLIFWISQSDWIKQSFRSYLFWAVSGLLSLLLITVTVLFPFPPASGQFDAGGLISRRALSLSGEAAVSSRWQLLNPLWEEIKASPILGAGFGETVTYISDDPRIREENPTGEYTTMTFEWGYLDLWLKLGLLGLVAYGYFILLILKDSYKTLRAMKYSEAIDSDRILLQGIVLGGIALLAIHFFSPYLNHPLGIGYLLFWAVVIKTVQTSQT